MNWFKKVFKQFINDKDDLNQEEKIEERIETESPHEWKKEMESKVIYQYPKGKFRFPVIPDSAEEKKREKRSKSENYQTPTVDKQKKEDEKIPDKSIHKEKVYKSKQPFKPSEVISPIYGYNRPSDFEKEELSSFMMHRNEENNEDLMDHERIVVDVQENNHSSFQAIETIASEEEISSLGQMEEEVDHRTDLDVFEESLEIEKETKNIQEIKNQNVVEKEQITEAEKLSNTIVAEENETEITSSSMTLEENQGIEKMTPAEEKKRGPMPFNVIMLNSDRQSLAKKRVEKHPIYSNSMSQVATSIEEQDDKELPYYVFPNEALLYPPIVASEKDEWVDRQKELLNDTLTNFNVHAKVVNMTQGPSVTRYEVQPEPGVKVSKITNLTDDLKLSLAARDIRIEAPIPGKHTVGIEVPNRKSRPVLIREIIESEAFKTSESPLTVALGLDISGKPIVTDLRKMPHGLIAGATGSGKSVCINTMLVSLLYKAKPEELKLLLIDPKMVELAPYNFIPHLASPVITDVKTATAALKWAVEEMERRYELLAHVGVRDITKYNLLAMERQQYSQKLPYIVIVIDELADLMMMAPADVEEAISRIAQKARACGIHLLIATQRPSVDVITGLIKANVPTRIAFSVSSQIDSRTVIDISGAEKLLGKGDMLFLENGTSKPVRLQGTFVSDEEIDRVVSHVRKEREPEYLFEQEELLKKVQMTEEEDELFFEACEFVIEQGGASTSSLQRNFKIGYNRAARLMEMMEKKGFISEAKGTKAREVLITESELIQLQENE